MGKLLLVSRLVVLGFSCSLLMITPAQGQLRNLFNITTADFYGSDIRGTEFGRDLEAIDEDGEVFLFEDFKGKVSLIFFGFTRCPDVCPTTLLQLSQLKAALTAEEAEQLQVYLITVDPERDTPIRLREYLSYFDPGFKALTGTEEQVATMAKSFNVFYNKVPTAAGQYTMEHSTYVFVLDNDAKSVLLFREGMAIEEMLSDIKKHFR
ncbi:MAG: SCO family protein [Alcaligenaceae bacterium]|jgi:cytochrome oxidase Cu insertion factor (SCO1/SenC/PrrC family)|nr:SCO family protein [Alcaligenaceae bacterium]